MRVRHVKQALKTAVASTLYYSGMLTLIATRKLKARAVVLTYHRVIPDSRQAYCHSNPGIVVREATFRKHLNFLKRFFHIISLDDFVDHMEYAKPFPDRSCLITFDDGWIDNYQTAFPMLQKFGVPATIFLPLDYIEGSCVFWQEELNLRLTQLSRSSQPMDRQYLRQIMQTDKNPSREQLVAYIQKLKPLGYVRIDQAIEQVRNHQRNTELPEHDNRYINWQQVEEMSAQGIAFGSHGLTHRILTYLPADEKRKEIEQSKTLLESKLAYEVKTIAYPNGDFDDTIVSLSREAGYKLGFSTLRGYVSQDTPPHAIPRINIHDRASYSEAALLCTVLGIF